MSIQRKQVSPVLEVSVSAEQHPQLGHTAGIIFKRHGIGNEIALIFSYNGNHTLHTTVTGDQTLENLFEHSKDNKAHPKHCPYIV